MNSVFFADFYSFFKATVKHFFYLKNDLEPVERFWQRGWQSNAALRDSSFHIWLVLQTRLILGSSSLPKWKFCTKLLNISSHTSSMKANIICGVPESYHVQNMTYRMKYLPVISYSVNHLEWRLHESNSGCRTIVDGERVFLFHYNSLIMDLNSNKVEFMKFHQGYVRGVAFSPVVRFKLTIT